MIIPNAKKTTLNNGLRIITEEIPSMRSIAMGILIAAGAGNEAPRENGISHLIEHMSFKGTKKRSAFEIAHALDAVGGKMNAYTAKEYTAYYAVVLDKHIEIAIDVLCDILQNSLFDPKAIEMEKGVVLEEIKMYEDSPQELIHDFFTEKILAGDPLGKPILGTKESVKSISREDILNYRKSWYPPGNIIVSLAGALPENLINKLKPYLESWQGEKTERQPTCPQIKASLNLKKKKTEQVHLCLGTKGVSQLDEDRYQYAVLENILGGSMSSRLFQEIREKRGLVYSIYATSSPFRNFGLSYVYAGTSKKNFNQVVDLTLDQFKKLKKEGIKPEELVKAKEYLKGSLVLGMESTVARMNWLAKTEFFYNRVRTIDEVFESIDKVTNDDVIAQANKLYDNKYLTLAVIGDMGKLPLQKICC